jgi:hypothetical protein
LKSPVLLEKRCSPAHGIEDESLEIHGQKMKKENKKTTFRRIVTQAANGKAVVESDSPIENYEFNSVPGYFHSLIWVNPTAPDLKKKQKFDRYPESVLPGPGGTSLHVVTFPPGSVFASLSFDPEAA